MKKILLAGLLTGFLAFGVAGIKNAALYKSHMGRTVSSPAAFSAFSGDGSKAYASFGSSIRCAADTDDISIGCYHGESYPNGDMMIFSSEVANVDMLMFDLDRIREDLEGVLSVSIGTGGGFTLYGTPPRSGMNNGAGSILNDMTPACELLQFGFDDQLLSNPDKKEPDSEAVSIPGAVWLLGAGLVVFVGIGSRRKKGE